MRKSYLLALVAAVPAAASAQGRALTVTPRAGYVLGSSVYSQLTSGREGGSVSEHLRVDGHLAVALTAAYRLGRSPISLFADAGSGTASAVRSSDRVETCESPCSNTLHVIASSYGPITLWHAAAGLSLRVEDRRGSGGTMNFMVGSAVIGAEYKEDFSGNAWSPQSFRSRGYFLGADVTHPLTRRVQLRGGVSDLVSRVRGPDFEEALAAELTLTNPTTERRFTNRIRFTAGVSVGL